MLDVRPLNWRYVNKMDIKPSAEVKKRLFEVEVEERSNLPSDLDKEMGDMQRADRLRWNYDFKRDQPLPGGRYSWSKVNTIERSLNLEGDAKRSHDEVDDESASVSNSSAPSTPSTASTPSRAHHVFESEASSPSSIPKITAFFRQRKQKRFSPSTSDESKVKRLRGSNSSPLRDQTEKPVAPRSLTPLFRPISESDSQE